LAIAHIVSLRVSRRCHKPWEARPIRTKRGDDRSASSDLSHLHLDWGSPAPPRAFYQASPHKAVISSQSEADMRHNAMSKKHGTQHNLVAELWVLTAVIAMIVVGDALAVS